MVLGLLSMGFSGVMAQYLQNGLMKTKEKIDNAKQRIKELECLIKHWERDDAKQVCKERTLP